MRRPTSVVAVAHRHRDRSRARVTAESVAVAPLPGAHPSGCSDLGLPRRMRASLIIGFVSVVVLTLVTAGVAVAFRRRPVAFTISDPCGVAPWPS